MLKPLKRESMNFIIKLFNVVDFKYKIEHELHPDKLNTAHKI